MKKERICPMPGNIHLVNSTFFPKRTLQVNSHSTKAILVEIVQKSRKVLIVVLVTQFFQPVFSVPGEKYREGDCILFFTA